MNEPRILKETQISKQSQIMNETQILKEHHISKQTQIMNEAKNFKMMKFPIKSKLQTNPKF